ncbi:unnamed protein product [Phytophthora lilii]|uniref:Unnamed protein product n=1 Tax=Phytophthora lilii TaxID=2077276 RepID=A0A9W6TID3_9STRA|nr:unnamed protein product [Phytophthora lilii]
MELAPTTSSNTTRAWSKQVSRHLTVWGRKCYDAWFDLQLIHSGAKYSVERMFALEEYTRNASTFRVVFATISLPLLIVTLVLCQEIVPLQDPAEGWKSNYGFWVRVGLVGLAIAQAVANKVEPWLEVPSLSFRQTLTYGLLVGLGHIAVGIAVAELWIFPIPFFMLTMSSASTILIIVGLRAVVGARTIRQISSQKSLRRRMNLVSGLQAFMGTAYPAYQVLFSKANHTRYELPVLLLLPIFKLATKAILARAASHKEEMIPEQVIFTVDFFDAFYLATFMQNLSSTTLILVLVLDLSQTAIEIQELYQRIHNISRHIRKITSVMGDTDTNDLLTGLRLMCAGPNTFR